MLLKGQPAFRKYYGCDLALTDPTENWKYNLDNNRPVGAVSLDLSKAFNSLPLDLLLAKLESRQNVLKAVTDFPCGQWSERSATGVSSGTPMPRSLMCFWL